MYCLDPEYAAGYSNLGNVLNQLGKFEEAEEAHKKSMELDPTDPQMQNNLGALYDELGRYHEAKALPKKLSILIQIMRQQNIILVAQIFSTRIFQTVGGNAKVFGKDGQETMVCHLLKLPNRFGMDPTSIGSMSGQNRVLATKLCSLQHSMNWLLRAIV